MIKLRPEERFPIICGRPLPEPKKLGRPFDKRLGGIVVRAAEDYRQRKYPSISKTADAYLAEYEPNLAQLNRKQVANKKYQLSELIKVELKKSK